MQMFSVQLLHKSVDMVEKRLTGSSGILTLKCKDFQTLKLEIPTADDCLNIAASVESLSNIGLFDLFFAFLQCLYATKAQYTLPAFVGHFYSFCSSGPIFTTRERGCLKLHPFLGPNRGKQDHLLISGCGVPAP